MKIVWSASAIALYFYAATILAWYGFISYFNIPSTFVDASLRDNVIFFYQLFTAYGSILQGTKWYFLIAYGLAAGVIWGLCIYSGRFKKVLAILGTIVLFLFGFGFFHYLGNSIAANETTLLTIPESCLVSPEGYRYIIPVITGDYAVLVPVDSNNKIMSRFVVKDPKSLPCQFEYKEFGKLTK